MKNKNFLAVLFLLILLLVVYWDHDRSTKKHDLQQQKNRFVKISDGSSFAFEIIKPNLRLRIENTSGQWGIVKPIVEDLDQKRFDSLLDTIIHSSYEREFKVEELGREFGFNEEETLVKIEKAKSTQYLRIGGAIPSGKGFYILNSEAPEPSVFIGDTDWALVKKLDFTEIRRKEIFRHSLNQIKSIAVKWAEKEYVLEQQKEAWVYTSGIRKLPVDVSVLEQFERYLLAVKFEEQTYNKKKAGFTETGSILISLLDGSKHKYSLVKAKGAERLRVFSEILKSEFIVFKNSLNFIDWNHNDFKNPYKAFQFKEGGISRIALNDKTIFVNKEGKWLDTENKNIPGAKLRYFFRLLRNSRIKEFYAKDIDFIPEYSIKIFAHNTIAFEFSWMKSQGGDIYATTNLFKASEGLEYFLFDAASIEKLLNYLKSLQGGGIAGKS